MTRRWGHCTAPYICHVVRPQSFPAVELVPRPINNTAALNRGGGGGVTFLGAVREDTVLTLRTPRTQSSSVGISMCAVVGRSECVMCEPRSSGGSSGRRGRTPRRNERGGKLSTKPSEQCHTTETKLALKQLRALCVLMGGEVVGGRGLGPSSVLAV